MCHALESHTAPVRSMSPAMAAAPFAAGKSLLFAKTNSGVPFKSSCDSMLPSICLLSSSCSSDDAASTTNMMACVSL